MECFLGDGFQDQLPTICESPIDAISDTVEKAVPNMTVYGKHLQENPTQWYNLVNNDTNTTKIIVPIVAFIPTSWAQFFLNARRTPGEGYLWIQNRISTANSPALNIAAFHLQGWLRAATVAKTNENQKNSSIMVLPWKGLHLDSAIVKWGNSAFGR